MKRTSIAMVIAASLGLTACAGEPGDIGFNKSTIGALLGAGGGAYGGKMLGTHLGPNGKIIAMAGGGLVGGLLGHSIGKSLDSGDMAYAAQAEQSKSNGQQQQTSWINPNNGHSGYVVPGRDGYDQGGNYCREYTTTTMIGGEPQQAYGVACRSPDGSWHIVK